MVIAKVEVVAVVVVLVVDKAEVGRGKGGRDGIVQASQ
jgi:hypothetical protein